MESILEILKNYESFIILALIILNVILIFSQILNKVEMNRLEKKYKKLMKGSSGKNIEDLLMDYNDKVDESLEAAKTIEGLYQNVDERLKKCVQKVSVIRFRAFDDVGSDLSFSIAFLNDKNDGVVFTGIYGRNECTTFAKPIDNGISKYDLSDEEKLAVRNAMNNK